MKFSSKYGIRNNHNTLKFNSVLWFFFFVVFLFVFADLPIEKIDIIYTVSYLITLFPPVYIAVYFLIPKYLKTGKNVVFLILLICNIFFFSFLNIQLHNSIIDFLFPDYYFISYVNNSKTVLLFFGAVLFAVLVKLFEDWVYLNQREKVMLQLELSALKNQINPHFLFNALNVIYSLSINKKEETTTAILNLSDILRYVIYEASNSKISIKKEIELIHSYIAFEKKRNVSNSKIDFNHTVDKEVEVYPMILLPLIENAFKHGLKSGVENPYIKIDLYANEKSLFFEVVNNFLPINKEDDYFSGVGLQNVKKHLEILYADKHEFNINSDKNVYKATLTITL